MKVGVNGMNDMSKVISLFVILIISYPIISYAHDTTHIHPLITDKIAQLIQNSDTGNEYRDIYELLPTPNPSVPPEVTQRLYWGTDFDQRDFPATKTQTEKEDYLLKLDESPYNRYSNVIDGVVREDIPSLKVLNHFYQAETGKALTLNNLSLGGTNSAITAMKYFNEAIEWMGGYATDFENQTVIATNLNAKQYAFFTFGKALHLVEDMSSPAHVHNDPHLVFKESEKDDYEGWYLPFLKINEGVDLPGFLAIVPGDTVTTVANPWLDIWGKTQETSLVKHTYDRTVFRETLHFPVDSVKEIVFTEEYIKPVPPADPTEELNAMFPCLNQLGELDYTVPNCLYWDEENVDVPSHWRINAVGIFHHQYLVEDENDWWPVEDEDNYSLVTENNPRGFNGVSARYYIEQLSKKNSDGSWYLFGTDRDIAGVPVIPDAVRCNFNAAWSADNPAVISTDQSCTTNSAGKSLLNIYAENLLKPAVSYGAGFTQYWYDIANTPPYLKSVQVTQSGNDVYSSSWKDIIKRNSRLIEGESCFSNISLCPTLDISLVDSREFILDAQQLYHVDANDNLIIKLAFNEPIKQVTQLRLGDFTETGSCVQPDNCVDITPPPLDENGKPVSGSGVVLSEETVPDNDLKVWQWEIMVDKSKIANLNGKLTLTVKALDMNKHTRGTQCAIDGVPDNAGGDLDATPNTPARRSLSKSVDGEGNPVNCYPWYQTDGIDPITADDNYSYDFEDGDQNHYLVFDTTAPTVSVDVQTTLPAPMTLP